MKRTYYGGNDFARAHNIEELSRMARRRLPYFIWEYIASGAEDERGLAWNRAVFSRWQFVPKTLVDTSALSLGTRLFGAAADYPLAIAPTGFNGLARRDADLDLARAAGRVGIPFTLSTVSNATIEDVARATDGPLWMQLYLLRDFAITEDLLRRARAVGVETLVVTTDANVAGGREWQWRCYRKPGQLRRRYLLDAALHPRWASGYVAARGARFENLRAFLPAENLSVVGGTVFVASQLQPTITWEQIRRLRDLWPHRLLVKGVLSAADTLLARDAGADGVVLSNHGGRQLDDAVSPMDVLADAVRAAPGFPILVDSGFRRGSDILKAVALGASAVMLGRASLYGVIAGGADGAEHALRLLITEMRRTMGLLGCNTLEEVASRIVPSNAPIKTVS